MARLDKYFQTTSLDRCLINAWVGEQQKAYAYIKEQREFSYHKWSHGGRGWSHTGQGGTGIMLMLMWYHHVHKKGSNEWRPKIILTALTEILQADYQKALEKEITDNLVPYVPVREFMRNECS